MFNFDKIDLQRIAVSSVGAVALSTACIFGVAGPAHAGTVKEWKAGVESQLDLASAAAPAPSESKIVETDVALRFTADGDYAGAAIAKSSGDYRLDHAALSDVKDLRFASLPESQRGAAHTVMVRILHNAPATVVAAERAKESTVTTYARAATGGAIKVAVK